MEKGKKESKPEGGGGFDPSVCPECGMPTHVIGEHIIEGKLWAVTYECNNCHHFSKMVELNPGA